MLPLYLSPTTRPTATLTRDAPSVIRARVRAVSAACLIVSLIVLWIIVQKGSSLAEAVTLLGWWPVILGDVARCVLLTAVLFVGPLYERGIIEGEWRSWLQPGSLIEGLSGWIGWRNYVAVSCGRKYKPDPLYTNIHQGPVTEEIIFRSAILPLHILAKVSPGHMVFLTPLYFGIAHIHHFYEFRLTHPETPLLLALIRPVFQLSYTTLFGWYAAFVYLRTGSLWAVILIHSFCNWNGLPRFWGRVEAYPIFGRETQPLHTGWTVAYYLLLVLGAWSFAKLLWPLTESNHALVSF